MLDLVAVVVIVITGVAGAETVRATCRRRLATPVALRVQPERQRLTLD